MIKLKINFHFFGFNRGNLFQMNSKYFSCQIFFIKKCVPMIVLKIDKKYSYFNEINLFQCRFHIQYFIECWNEHCKKTSKMDAIVNILHIIVYYFHWSDRMKQFEMRMS